MEPLATLEPVSVSELERSERAEGTNTSEASEGDASACLNKIVFNPIDSPNST